MKKAFLVVILCFIFQEVLAQERKSFPSPYKTTWVDGAVSAGAIGINYWGLRLMRDKEPVSEIELEQIDANLGAVREDVPWIDRWAVGNYSERAERWSDYPFYASFGLPLLFLSDHRTRAHAPQIGLLYLETMAITGAIFAQTNGRIERIRPSVYNPTAGEEVRLDDKSKNAFYGGHTSATAAATFFAAKVFNDFFPDSPARPYIWAGAAVVPASVAYLRIRAGKHFISDNIFGYAIGAGVGILVPHLHKVNSRLSISPTQDLFGNNLIQFKYRLIN